jgi:hypothetical protein
MAGMCFLEGKGYLDVEVFLAVYTEVKTTAELLILLNSFDNWRSIPGKVFKGWYVNGNAFDDDREAEDILALDLENGDRWFYTAAIGRKAGKRLGHSN